MNRTGSGSTPHAVSGGAPQPADVEARVREFRAIAELHQARQYLAFYGPVTSLFLDEAAQAALPVPGGGLALDVGCGDGALATRLRRLGWRCVAVDLSLAMCRIADQSSGGGQTVTASASALPFADGVMDAVAGGFLLPHLGDLTTGLVELRRVLRAGGQLVLTNWAAPALSPFTGLLSEMLRELEPVGAGAVLGGLERRTAPDHLRRALGAAGFDDVCIRHRSHRIQVPSPLAWWEGSLKGSYGMRRLLQQQAPDVREAAKSEFLARAEAFGPQGGPLDVPVSALVISARRA
ncbi:class I SAM-dependent methyltransferase [Streptomyces sp. NBC_01205]|uniref:class I SAM-dependent methyltransferase n=1 Tax=Streptomyces sp. NBC_01205 TaxID=2903771 RepID=UPI002E10AFA8|nr:methyltransferase domain-containing protein [Streptomyces sp. NBC_01205]